MQHPHEDDLPALALGALDCNEMRAIHKHLAICPGCQAAIGTYRAVVSLLPYAAEPQEPPADLKQRILSRIVQGGGPQLATITQASDSLEGR
jgi:anti-sigma factor ChrR (cupin superfamily)